MFLKHLADLVRPAGAPDRSAVPIAGDSAAAKTVVVGLIDSLGYDTYDVGSLAESRRFAPGTPAQLAYLDPDGMFSAPATSADLAALSRRGEMTMKAAVVTAYGNAPRKSRINLLHRYRDTA